MKRVVVTAMAAGVVLAGCGSSGQSAESSAPVESASGVGAPASADECPANAPVRGLLKGRLEGDDGVFGHVYNSTGDTLWVWSQVKDSPTPCRLAPGKGASFASDSVEVESKDAAWVPPRKEAQSEGDLSRIDRFWILVTGSAEATAPGVAVGLVDPLMARPDAVSIYRSPGGGTCASDNVALYTGGLSENREYRLKGNSQGSVLVKRLSDSKEIAREWMPGNTDTDDWARLDLYVESIGRC